MRRLGVGYRHEIAPWILSSPAEISCLEITAEHFFYDRHLKRLKEIREKYPIVVHGLSLSLGTNGPIHEERLKEFQQVVALADPLWISEHVAFTRTSALDLGHLTPVQYTEEQLSLFVDNATELTEVCKKPLILENITSHIKIEHQIEEPDFLNRLCEKASCGLLLDVTNLFVNSSNLKFDPYEWLKRINPQYVRQLHVVGYSQFNGILFDSHSENLSSYPELLKLISHVEEHFEPEMTIIERDEHFPESRTLANDVYALSQWKEKNVVSRPAN